jgi:hypothetical protein
MTLYNVALFLHILGAVAIGAADVLLLAGLLRARGAHTVAELRLWSGLAEGSGRMIAPAVVVLLVPAMYMVVTAWGWTTAWIDVALGALLILPLLGRIVLSPRLNALHTGALQAPDGPVPAALRRRRTDPAMWAAVWISTAVYVGIIFLMTNKPDLGVSLATMAVALIVGAALPLVVRPRSVNPIAPQTPMAVGVDGER